MTRTLDVYLHQNLVGQLIQDDDGQTVFDYARSWLKNPAAVPLSQSLPLRPERFKQQECRGFFGGILPEGGIREKVAKILGISARNDFAMLERIGGECAGAVTFVPTGTNLPKTDHHYRAVRSDELAKILKSLPRQPLMAGEEGVRLSLAGAQDKIAVHLRDGKISIPLGSAPSTHILKPAIERFDGVVFNEAFCMSLATAVGLPTAKTSIENVGGIEYLQVERYDRHIDQDGTIQRLHQEDFCQALGIPSETKYQSEGGPRLSQCFSLLRLVSTTPVIDLRQFLDTVIFNLLVGNHDAHGKNFSLLYMPDGTTRLAPLYDVVSTVLYPELTDKMAMKIGAEAKSDLVGSNNFEKFASETGLAKPIVNRRVPELATVVMETIGKIEMPHAVSEKVAELIRSRCESFHVRFTR